MKDYLKQINFLALVYADGSRRIIRTTLNQKLLGDIKINPEFVGFYDFLTERLVPLEDGVKLEAVKNDTIKEVEKFVSKLY